MFFIMGNIDFGSYGDYNRHYATGSSIEGFNRKLENDSIKLFKWFSYNQVKVNKDKWNLHY